MDGINIFLAAILSLFLVVFWNYSRVSYARRKDKQTAEELIRILEQPVLNEIRREAMRSVHIINLIRAVEEGKELETWVGEDGTEGLEWGPIQPEHITLFQLKGYGYTLFRIKESESLNYPMD